MSPNSTDPDRPDDAPADTAVRRTLADARQPPSAAHDQSILDAAREFSATAPPAAAASTRSHRWPLALAAGALLVIGMTITLFPREATDPTVLRGSDAQTQALPAPADGAALSRLPDRFTWLPGAAGSSYRLTLRDAAGERLWQSRWLSEPTQVADSELLAQLQPGRDYFWMIEQRGTATTTMGPYRFSVLD